MNNNFPKKISIVIPAYNNPRYTRKTLTSIIAQTHRPIEIILSDDNSPISLETLYLEFNNANHQGVELKYFRNKTNLRTYWNSYKALSHASGEYFVWMSHDDWFIDDRFLEESLKIIEQQNDVYVAIGNSIMENACVPFMDIHYHQWLTIEGAYFINPDNPTGLWGKAHPVYSAILFDRRKLLDIDFLKIYTSLEDAKKMGLEPDEAFVSLIMLGQVGNIAICGKIYSVRGNPSNSYSKTEFWTKTVSEAVFVQLFNLYRNISCAESKKTIKKIIAKQCRTFNRINFNIITYFEDNKSEVSKILLLGYIRWLCSQPRVLLGRLFRQVKSIWTNRRQK
jgi:glycosyltransferase involved in cell wall biosynthesis